MPINIDELRDAFCNCVVTALDEFSQTEANAGIYALVFDCDSEETGQICLRYANMAHFNHELENYERYRYMYEPYGKYGLRGYKYCVGDFPFIDLEFPPVVAWFLDSYYYYATGDYYGEGQPVTGLENSFRDIWKDMILSCIKKLKASYTGLRVTGDFIIYMCDHDQSDEDTEEWIKWTVDEALFQKLLNDSYL